MSNALTTPSSVRSSAEGLRYHVSEAIEMLTSKAREELGAESNDLIRAYLDRVDALKRGMMHLDSLLEHTIESLEFIGFENDSEPSQTGKPPRRLVVEVTQGMINQNLLTLTEARQRGQVRVGEKFEITLPSGRQFETDLCPPGNKLRERSMIREFYAAEHIKAGDKVALVENDQRGSWRLIRADAPAQTNQPK